MKKHELKLFALAILAGGLLIVILPSPWGLAVAVVFGIPIGAWGATLESRINK